MEIGLKKTSVNCYKKVYSGNISREESSDFVVPDIMPDIGEIISTCATVYLRNKEILSEKVNLSGIVCASVLYLAEDDNCPKKINAEIPFSISADSADITAEALSTGRVNLTYIEARAINPRKIYLRAGLSACIDAYEREEIAFGTALGDACTIDIYTKKEQTCAELVCGVWEKTFILTDEYPLSGGKSAAQELIGQSVDLSAEDVKFVGTKMIFKGMLKADLLWVGEDGDVSSSTFSSGFSQIMDLGLQLETGTTKLDLMLTGAYFELIRGANDSKVVTAELHILAQASCTEKTELHYIADAYSNTRAINTLYGDAVQLHTSEQTILRDNMRGLIETPYQVRDVLYITPEIGQYTMTENGFGCPINIKLLLRDEDGRLHGLVRSFNAKWEIESNSDSALNIQEVRCAELYATAAAGGVEVRLQAQAYTFLQKNFSVQAIESIIADETNDVDLSAFPSVVVLPHRCDDYWKLAKLYHSSVELIEAANTEIGSNVLLIPKSR